MYVPPSAPLSIGGILDDAIKRYRVSFRACWLIALLGAAISGGIDIFVAAYARNHGLNTHDIFDAITLYQKRPIIEAYLIGLPLSAVCYSALFLSMNSMTSTGQQMSIVSALGAGVARLGAVLIAGALAIVFVVAGLMLIVPGIYLMGALILWPVALLIDGASPLNSLQMSRQLIAGHWHRTGIVLTVASIFVASLIMLFDADVITGALTAPLQLGIGRTRLLAQTLSIIGNTLILPMVPAAMMAIYSDLKLKKNPA
jgi:hypothetical protein